VNIRKKPPSSSISPFAPPIASMSDRVHGPGSSGVTARLFSYSNAWRLWSTTGRTIVTSAPTISSDCATRAQNQGVHILSSHDVKEFERFAHRRANRPPVAVAAL
jgi:hypothetical protein